MQKYTIYFTTNDGDVDKECRYANSQAEAINLLLHERRDVKTIDNAIREF